MVPSFALDEIEPRREAQMALALHEARVNFFPGARPQRRRATQENMEELKLRMALVGDQTQSILCSLAFRAWTLSLAEEKRHVAELSCRAGVALVRRNGHFSACRRVVEEKLRLQQQLQLMRCFRQWSWRPGSEPGKPYRLPGAVALALRDGHLLGQIFGLWRTASTGSRSLWFIETERAARRLEGKLSVGQDALGLSFMARHALKTAQQLWRAWVQKVRLKRRAEELYYGCQKTSCLVTAPLCFKAWAHQLRRLKAARCIARQCFRMDLSQNLRWRSLMGWRRFAALRGQPRYATRALCSLATSSTETHQNERRLLAFVVGLWRHRGLRRRVMQGFQLRELERHDRQGLVRILQSWRDHRRRHDMLRRHGLRRLGDDQRLGLFMAFDYWHRHLKADLRQADLQRLTLKGTFQRWQRKHQNIVWAMRTGLVRETEATRWSLWRHRALFRAWQHRARRRRHVARILQALGGADLRGIFSAWTFHFFRRKRRSTAGDRCAARIMAEKDGSLRALTLHAWWSVMLLQRHGDQDRFHVAQRKLLHWRLSKELELQRGRRMSAHAVHVLATSEALGEERAKHFLTARALVEWRRQVTEQKQHRHSQDRLGRRDEQLLSVANAWAADQARLHLQGLWRCWRIGAHGNRVQHLHSSFQEDTKRFLKAWARGDLLFLTDLEALRRRWIFLHWRRDAAEAKRLFEVQRLEEKLRQSSMARLALAEGLQGAQGSQMSNLFLQHLLTNWHKSANAEKEERRLLRRRQLASVLVDASSRLGQQMTMSQVLFAWSGLAMDSKAAEWARKTAHAQSAKAALAARIAFGETTGGLSDFVRRWHGAATLQRRARAKEAARQALALSLDRQNLRGAWQRWLEAFRMDSTERWLHQQKEEATRKERLLKMDAARRFLESQAGAFSGYVLQSWQALARDHRRERRHHTITQILAEGLHQSCQQHLVLNAWLMETTRSAKARGHRSSERNGSRRLARGLLPWLDKPEPFLQIALHSWNWAAMAEKADRRNLQHGAQQQSDQVELQRLARSLLGGQRRLLVGLASGQSVQRQLIFEAWRRRRVRGLRARDFVGSLLTQESDLCVRQSIYRWRAHVHLRRKRKQAMGKVLYYISHDEVCHRRVLWTAWRSLLQDARAVLARQGQRDLRCGALQRMVLHFDSTLLMSVIVTWQRCVKAAKLRKRLVKGGSSLCDTVDGMCQVAQLQAIFTAWIDVLLISQSAALRLGLRTPKAAQLGFYGAHLGKRSAVDEAQLKQQLAEAAKGQAMLAPLRLQHLALQAVFSHWRSLAAQVCEGRRVAVLLLERCDLAIQRACFGGWRHVHGLAPSQQQRRKSHQWMLRRKHCLSQLLSRPDLSQALQAAFLCWWRSALHARGERLGTPRRLSLLQELSGMVWAQDRRRELISHAITAWWAGAAQHRAERGQRAAEHRRHALLQSCDALTRGEPELRAAATCLRFLLAWQQHKQASRRSFAHKKVKSSMVGVMGALVKRNASALSGTCLVLWRREVEDARQNRGLHRRRNHCWRLSEIFENQSRLIAFISEWFLRWRSVGVTLRLEHCVAELRMLAGLLQESTITCRELRTQLLTMRGSSNRVGRATVWALLVAWHRVVTDREGVSETSSFRTPKVRPPLSISSVKRSQ